MVEKTPSTMKEAKISWEQYNEDIHKLAEGIKVSKLEFHCIFAIPRGGYVIGVHLSHLLKIPLTVNPYGTFLVVDDVSDSGKTLQEYRSPRYGKRCKLATLYVKEGTSILPLFYVATFKKDVWIEFPWEV